MYAVKNIKKFVDDNATRIGDRAEGILKRAEEVSRNGVISGGSVEEIMQDDALAAEFHKAVMEDMDHIRIGMEAIQASR